MLTAERWGGLQAPFLSQIQAACVNAFAETAGTTAG